MSNQLFPSFTGLDIAVKRFPVFATKVQTASSGKEQRASFQSFPRYRFELRVNFLRQAGFFNTAVDEAATLGAFLMSMKGRWDSFLFLDSYDSSDVAMGFGVGNGSTTTFQLQRREPGVYSNFLGTFAVPSTPRKNLVLYSQDLTNAIWSKYTGVTATANADVAPDGTVTASKVVYNGAGVVGGDRFVQNVGTAASGTPYTISIWLRASAPITLQINNNNGASTPISLTTQWQRFTLPGTGTGALLQLWIQAVPGNNSAFTVYAWGGQAEVGSVATDYIPTTAAVVTATPSYYPGADGFEPVTEPAPGIQVFIDGVLYPQGTAYTLGAGGLITFTGPPAAGAVLTWSGSYYRRVRLDSDESGIEQMVQGVWDGQTIKLISVK